MARSLASPPPTGRGHLLRALLEAAAYAVRHNLETMAEAGATIRRLRSSGGGVTDPLWPQIVSDVTGLPQDVRAGEARAAVGAALFAAVAAGAADLVTQWDAEGPRVEPDPALTPVYDDFYGRFRDLALTTAAQAHALAAWQREHA